MSTPIGFGVDNQCGAWSFYSNATTVAEVGFKIDASFLDACPIDCDEVVLGTNKVDRCHNQACFQKSHHYR